MSKLAYTYAEAADEVGLSERSVKQEAADGNLVPSWYHSKPLIPHAELVRWLESLPTEKP